MSGVFGVTGALQRALGFHLERHNVLGSNVANVDTPGFRPVDLVRPSSDADSQQLRMTRTEASHLSAAGQTAGADAYIEEDRAAPVGADGNGVSLDREMSKLAANDIRYQGAAKLVAHHFGMLRYAANDGQG